MNDHLSQMKVRMREKWNRYGKPDRNCTGNGFKCIHCHGYVILEHYLIGVRNRNHCPYCLWSRHMDMFKAGDRLSACKSPMQPIGLTTKASLKKYGLVNGELMLVHQCKECNVHSINRIAADDIPQNVFAVFEASFHIDSVLHASLESEDIHLLGEADILLVRRQLFGYETVLADHLGQDRVIEDVEHSW